LLVAMLVVGAFLGGRHFEHRQRMMDREQYAASLEALVEENVTLRQRQSNPFLSAKPGTLRRRAQADGPYSWQKDHAEAAETRGFEGATPAGK
jgi:hypothetical protein